MNEVVNSDGSREVEITTLQALKLTLELGGDEADIVANASNEEISEVLNNIDKVRIIV